MSKNEAMESLKRIEEASYTILDLITFDHVRVKNVLLSDTDVVLGMFASKARVHFSQNPFECDIRKRKWSLGHIAQSQYEESEKLKNNHSKTVDCMKDKCF